jgi:hypothetical protein
VGLAVSRIGRHNGWWMPAVLKNAEQEARALREREANARAAAEGRPLPHPNIWDALDPTKVDRNATPAEVHASYVRFAEICRPRARKRHRL